MSGPAPFTDLTPLIAILKSTLTEEQRRIVAAWLLLPDWMLPPEPELDLRQWGLDPCTGCGGAGQPCRQGWVQQRKCCPDCSHG